LGEKHSTKGDHKGPTDNAGGKEEKKKETEKAAPQGKNEESHKKRGRTAELGVKKKGLLENLLQTSGARVILGKRSFSRLFEKKNWK